MPKAKSIRITAYLKGHPKAKVLKAIWDASHKDFKSSSPEHCFVLTLRDNQGSVFCPLKALTPVEVEHKTPNDFKNDHPESEWKATEQEVKDANQRKEYIILECVPKPKPTREKKITIQEYLRGDPRNIELFKVWQTNKARQVNELETCSMMIYRAAKSNLVALKDLTDDEIFLLLPGHLRKSESKSLNVSLKTLNKLKIHLRRDPKVTGSEELARIFIDITTDWPEHKCTFTVYNDDVMVEWSGDR